MAEPIDTEPVGDVADASALNPESLGFMCGIEVHQQLATGKLHSRQPGNLYDVTIDTVPDEWKRFNRRLRAARGEGGTIDVAARFESRRNRSFVYIQSPNAGLIELDEQPPLTHDDDAVSIALTVSALLNAKPVSLLQTMRKTVVDGSNTSGFQRTSLISVDGILQTETGPVGVDVLCLEEDSARKLDTLNTGDGEQVIYNLDRLGLPLIEIATAPDIISPEHAKETSIALGRCLRQTRRVRRGLGSIRQDLNVSLACGDRVEIKGCQDLSWIPRIIRLEMSRQLHFYRLANELRSSLSLPLLPPDRRSDDAMVERSVRDAVESHLPLNLDDVSVCFSVCDSKMVQTGFGKGSVMLALPLPELAGRFGTKAMDSEDSQLPRLGRELAGAAKLAGVKGVFHSDELPAYGIESEHVAAVRQHLSLSESDGFVLCLAPQWQAELALESVLTRCRLAWHRIPQEVRNVVVKKGAPEDGTTAPMRPLPGGARMYPETDVPVLTIDHQRWQQTLENLPMSDEERKQRLSDYEVSDDQARQLLARELDDTFVDRASQLPHKGWASVLLENDEANPDLCANVLAVKEAGLITRESINDIIAHFAGMLPRSDEIAAFGEANGFKPADEGDLGAIIDGIVAERADFVRERKMGAMGPLMGVVMQAVGAADGKVVSALLREAIQKISE
ncbi:MAG: Glu-tRNA(Gln) amidotransferase GatDE subunit E [Euryarchaeota archaeon]|nr:Glu-tRNA(Gln) amidotransferase GatDE subunit E [Euryarchaeota archaeon]